MPLRPGAPRWGRLPAFLLVMCAFTSLAAAQPKGKASKPDKAEKADAKVEAKGDKKDKVKNFDFNALDLNGRMRTPQLLYFLERANEELERASLEKRSFIPAMAKSVEEEAL